MSTELVDAFTASVGGTATIHTSTSGTFRETLSESITEPAVGTPLSLEGVTLAETPVETNLTPTALEQAETGVTAATYAIAEYGTIAVPTDADGTELVSLYSPRHVAVLGASQIVPDMEAAYERFAAEFREGNSDEAEQNHPQTQVFATGPSATADMGTLVQGVHGPHEVHIIVVEDR